ncbi:hypothetical protein PRZ48_002675 [Zasmidium cellare]|uniref:PEBP-like protein n=1 Tax=Zasmidium cellare TaxID=395010 RepID=A0ABR0EV42_ZASCE|nr:hypothetical protein PRZ48_002675 [Zasmidium cellare]
MALERSARPLAQSLRCTRHERIALPIRSFTSSTARQETETQQQSTKPPLDPFTVATPRLERKLLREQKKIPIGSRRRRAAMLTSPNIPFVELPYQCFQEARKYLQEDRTQKLEEIRVQRERIERLADKVVVDPSEQQKKNHRLRSMRQYLEELKILADINDPMIKKKFEDGQGDMNKPIYRHLADKKWRSHKRLLLMQRIEQMHVTPDVLAKVDPIVETTLSFTGPSRADRHRVARMVQHGDIVDSRVSEKAPTLRIQPFQKGEKLYTIAVINPDVPNVAADAFDTRCHFLACNIPVSPTKPYVQLGRLNKEQIVLPWLPAFSQKGLPYQRMSIWILEQPPQGELPAGSNDALPSKPLDVKALQENEKSSTRENFNLRGFVGHTKTTPVGVDLFRTVWDEGTAGVMRRAGIIGGDVEFKNKRIEPLPYKRLKENRYR